MKNIHLIILVVAVIALIGGWFLLGGSEDKATPPDLVVDAVNQEYFLGAVGEKLIENYVAAIKYNEGYKSELPMLLGGTLTVTGTTTIARSVDGFVAGGFLTDSGTTTPVQTIYTALSNIACDANTIGLHVISQAVFIGVQRISVGTTTSSGGATDNLIASSTIASTTNAFIIEGFGRDTNGASFVMQTGDRIQISLADGEAPANTSSAASSTNYASRDIEFGIWCWNLSI